jgi:hypothetical protein
MVERTDGVEAPVPALLAAGADRSRALEIAELSTAIGRFEPAVRLDREERVERRTDGTRTGTVYERFDVSGALAIWSGGRVVVGGGRRIDRTLATGTPWADARRAREHRVQVEMPRIHNLALSGSFTRRQSETVATGDRSVSDLVQVDMVSSDLDGGLGTEVHVDVTTTDVSARGRELVFVGEGQGLYDEFGRFVGIGGDHDLRASSANGSDLRTRVLLNARTEFRPARVWRRRETLTGWRRVLSWTGYETTLFVDELSRRNLASLRFFFDPSSYQRRDSTFQGRFRFRQDVDLLEGNRALAARVRYERVDEADSRTGGVFTDSGDESVALRLRSSPLRPLSLEWTGSLARGFDEQHAGESSLSRVDLRRNENRFELTVRPSRTLRVNGVVLRRVQRDRPTGASIRTVEIGPGVTINRRKMRAELRLRWSEDVQSGFLPIGFGGSLLPGTTTEYDFNVDYRATRHVTLTGRLDGVGRPRQEFLHTARMELRASF